MEEILEKEMRGLSPWNSVTLDYVLTVLRNFHRTQEIIMDWYFENVTRVEPGEDEEKYIKKSEAFVFSDEERRKLKKDLRTVMGTYEKAVKSAGLELLKRHGSRKMRSMLEENIFFKTRELYWGSKEEENLENAWIGMKNMKEKAEKLYGIAKNMVEEKRHKIIMELGDMDNALQLLGRKRRHFEEKNVEDLKELEGNRKSSEEPKENINRAGEEEKNGKIGLKDLPEI